jgi:tetratricopeptide (TPR) repeat protein
LPKSKAGRQRSLAHWTAFFTRRWLYWSALGALLTSACAPGWGQPPDGLTPALDAVELNVAGQKFTNLPPQQRLDNLEKLLPQPVGVTPAGAQANPTYRINQIFNAQQAAASQGAHQAAIAAYNHGSDESAQGHIDAAMAAYRQALQFDPHLISAYNNLANLQEKQRLFGEATDTYQQALRLAPNEPLLHLNLAIILEKQGKISEAYQHYRAYVQLSPSPKPQIVELVKNDDSKGLAGKGQNDYSNLASQESHGERLTWPTEMLPLPVCIQLGDREQVPFIQNIYQDFDLWSQVTNGRLSFREVSFPDMARIVIILKAGPLMDPNASVGHASFSSEMLDTEFPMRNLKVHITVNTGEFPGSDLPLGLRQEQVGKLVLHELGHAIGIWGHSKDPGDIMYTHPIVSQLSQRDINTVHKLYDIR